LLGLGELIDQYLRMAGIAGAPGGLCGCDLASERVRPIWGQFRRTFEGGRGGCECRALGRALTGKLQGTSRHLVNP
jgi:hypothetical protein